jgi:glycosyltransferase involved in cell wall biosynthesis
MTRVLHVTRDYPPRHCGGISTAVGALVRELKRASVPCAVVSFDDYLDRTGVRSRGAAHTDVVPERQANVWRVDDEDDLRAIPAFAAEFAPDLIQLHVDLLWDVAAELRERLAVPLVATLHVCQRRLLRILGAGRASASLAAQERALELADLVVAPTRAAADAVLEDYPRVAARLHVARFTVHPGTPASLTEPRLVTVGRFGAAKGTDRLVALLPHLLEEPELRIDVVGGLPRNPRRDRRWRQRIAESAGAHGDRVHVHGWLDPLRRDRVLANARAWLSTSRIETSGLAALEALAMGVPVCGYHEPALVESAPEQVWFADAEPRRAAREALDLLAERPRCLDLGRSGRAGIRPWAAVVGDWQTAFAALRPPRA